MGDTFSKKRISDLFTVPMPATIDWSMSASAIVVSGEWGWTKPHPGIYREALRRMNVTHERALFVGDDLLNDVKGPKAVGMRAAWFAPGRQTSEAQDADTHIVDLRELLAWCREYLDPTTRLP